MVEVTNAGEKHLPNFSEVPYFSYQIIGVDLKSELDISYVYSLQSYEGKKKHCFGMKNIESLICLTEL